MSQVSVTHLQNTQNGMVNYIQSAQAVVAQAKAGVHAMGGGVGEPSTEAALATLEAHLSSDLAALQAVMSQQANITALAEAASD